MYKYKNQNQTNYKLNGVKLLLNAVKNKIMKVNSKNQLKWKISLNLQLVKNKGQ